MEVMINKTQTSKYGEKLISYTNSFEDDIKKITAIIENINLAWEGNESLKYVNVMKEKYIAGLQELKDVLEDYGTYLKKVSDSYSSVDEVYSSKKINV